jgi:hypothetical protein
MSWLVVVALVLVPILGIPVLVIWSVELAAEILWVITWVRLRRAQPITA